MDIPLSEAAVIAYREVFTTRPAGHVPTNDELDLVALVLSGYVPIYGIRSAGTPRSLIVETELLQGMFWGGARRFEQRSGAIPITGLVVRSAELRQALERIRSDVWQES